MISSDEFSQVQAAYCSEQGVTCVLTPEQSKIGFASSTAGRLPVNGLRHPPRRDTSGWYIWSGQYLPNAPDFFVPLCANHLYEQNPELIRLLGLPPGYRFLLAGGHLDVWFDESLLDFDYCVP